MIVTAANSPFDQQNADSHGAEKNHLSDVRGGRGDKPQQQQGQPRRDKRDVHGWIVLDKPIGMTSTHAVAVVKRLFQAKRAGHAARSIRSPPAACRSPWVRPPRPFRS